MTFSLVACDLNASSGAEWGVVVASKFLAVGSVVPWARAGVGAVATQAFAEISFGPRGLEMLESGEPADKVVDALISADSQGGDRQLGIVDVRGRAATFTGDDCFDWAGGVAREGFCCQGNILVGPEVVDDCVRAFEEASGDLATRLVAGLSAGDRAGGDRRGRQSAGLLVTREGAGYGGASDVAVDLRVDDHADPVGELGRLLDLHRLYFPRLDELDFTPIDADLASEIRSLLVRNGYSVPVSGPYDEGLKKVLFEYVGTENLEERWSEEPQIEKRVLQYMRNAST